MNGSNHKTSTQPGEIEIPFRAVAPETEQRLNDKQLFDHRTKAEEFARWMLVFGKNPEQVEGYAKHTASRTMHRVGYFHRWTWDQEKEYVSFPTQDHAESYLQELAYDDYSAAHKAKCQQVLK